MTDATSTAPAPALLALDADGEKFVLDFGFPAVTTRPVAPARDEDTADGLAALDGRDGRNAVWREANLIPAAKPRG